MRKNLLSFILLIVFCSCFIFLFSGCESGCKNADKNYDNTDKFELVTYKAEIGIDMNYQIIVKGGTDSQIIFVTENESIATVNDDGKVTGIDVGETVITVTIGSHTNKFYVTVYDSGEIPHINLKNIDGSNLVRGYVGDSFPVSCEVIFNDKSVDASFKYSSLNESVVKVSGNEIKFIEIGSTDIIITAEYKKWTIQKIAKVEVVDNVAVFLNENFLELSTSGVVGQKTSYSVDEVVVTINGKRMENPNVVWTSSNPSVAKAENGVITAISIGNTEVRANFTHNEIEYYAYIDVKVVEPYLNAPINLKFNDDSAMLTWDCVDYADKYEVVADGTAFTVNTNEFKGSNYFGGTYFSVKAISDDEGVLDSDEAILNYNIISKDLTEQALVYEYLDADITLQEKFKEKTGYDVYFADCTHTEPFNWQHDSSKYGYIFKKVHVLERTANMGISSWCKTSLISNKEAIAKYYGAQLSLWVYAPQDITIRYAWSHVESSDEGNFIIAQQTVPANKWTKVSFTISRKDFPLVTFLTSSDDFYFTDIRVSNFGYIGKDYSVLPFYLGWDAQDCINEVNLIALEDINATHEGLILTARNAYESLTVERKGQITGYSDFVLREDKFYEAIAQPFIDGFDDLPLINELSLDDSNQVLLLRSLYDNLLDRTKELQAVKDKYASLIKYENKIRELHVQNVNTLIALLPNAESVTVADEEDVIKARKAYDNLLDSEKESVEDYNKLLQCESAIKVCTLVRLIDIFPDSDNVSSKDGDFIIEALLTYTSLTEKEKAKITNIDKLIAIKSAFDTKYPYIRFYDDANMKVTSLNTDDGLDYVIAKENIQIIYKNADTENYQGEFVYNGEFGNLFRISVTPNGSGVGTNWAVVAEFESLLSKMDELDSNVVKLFVYNNTAKNEVLHFGHFKTVRKSAIVKSVYPGWNVLTFTKEEIKTIVSLNSFIANDDDAPSEYWISDFFIQNFKEENTSNRVFGDSLISSMASVNGADHLKAKVSISTENEYSFIKGNEGYVYGGDFGNVIKVNVDKNESSSYGGNWGLIVDFETVLQAMEEKQAQTATIYIYANVSTPRFLMFGKQWFSGYYYKYGPGWKEFTFTKAQIQALIDNGSMICGDDNSFEGGEKSVEYWISDFFLDETDVMLP